MREIKHRGFSTKGQWHCGSLTVVNQPIKSMGIDSGYYIANKDGFPFAYQVIPETVGQYTGYIDCSKNEVYERDICERKDELQGYRTWYLVVWDEEKAQFRMKVVKSDRKLIQKMSFPISDYSLGGMKLLCNVVGNAYKNRELLKD